MSKRNVYLSAGHSGPGENGVCSEWLNERVETVALAGLVAANMKSLSSLKLRSGGLRLSGRISEASRFCGVRSGIAVELHFNAGGSGEGTECVVADEASQESRRIGLELSALVSSCLGTRNRGLKRECDVKLANGVPRVLGFVRKTTCPAVIVEVCFAGSKEDCEKYYAMKGQLAYELAKYFDN